MLARSAGSVKAARQEEVTAPAQIQPKDGRGEDRAVRMTPSPRIEPASPIIIIRRRS